MGGSTRVSLDIRVKMWLESTKALLKHLDVQHVSIFAHSAGTIYAFNTIYSLRGILDPERPFMAVIGDNHNSHA